MKASAMRASRIQAMALLITLLCIPAPSQGLADEPGEVPRAAGWLGAMPARFSKYDVVAVPDQDRAEWWAGGPSVVRDREGIFWMAARMRTAEAPLGQRGYEIRIFQSSDGAKFQRVHSLRREDVPLPGFERPALLLDPHSGKFKLYACGRLPNSSPADAEKSKPDPASTAEDPWCIFKFGDATSPERFVAKSAHAVIVPPRGDDRPPSDIVGEYVRPAPVPEGYKDPVILFAEGKYHAYVIGVLRSERTCHFSSSDGEHWTPEGGYSHSILDLAGWHNFAVRPASVVPVGAGYLFVYEGSDTRWPDPVYNIVTGLGFTFDLHHVQDLTPTAPLVVSPTPGRLHTWRYSHWMWVDDELWVYAEVEKPNGAHEIRRYRLARS